MRKEDMMYIDKEYLLSAIKRRSEEHTANAMDGRSYDTGELEAVKNGLRKTSLAISRIVLALVDKHSLTEDEASELLTGL